MILVAEQYDPHFLQQLEEDAFGSLGELHPFNLPVSSFKSIGQCYPFKRRKLSHAPLEKALSYIDIANDDVYKPPVTAPSSSSSLMKRSLQRELPRSKPRKTSWTCKVEGAPTYTDTDWAAEMNSLSSSARQAMEEDIHGVGKTINETADFVKQRILEMQKCILQAENKERQAWDQAVYLRPCLESCRDLHLMMLRATKFHPNTAATLLLSHYAEKRTLFGDDLFVQRITWQNLTQEEQKISRSGMHKFIPNGDVQGRGVLYIRLAEWDVSKENAMAFARSFFYVFSSIQDHPETQKKGVVLVYDHRGEWKSSSAQVFKFLRNIQKMSTDTFPFSVVCLHQLYDDKAHETSVQTLRGSQTSTDSRLRCRFHFGSQSEIDSSLQSFGIDTSAFATGDQAANVVISKQMERDETWLRSEQVYRDPTSRVVLIPTKNDVLLGRKQSVIQWQGNSLYCDFIRERARAYTAADGTNGIDKTMIVVESIQMLKNELNIRFLKRNGSYWEIVDDYVDIRRKVSSALRKEARRQLSRQQLGTTSPAAAGSPALSSRSTASPHS